MIKWFYHWDEWRKAYWGLIDKHSELFAFLHRMYVFQHLQELGRQDTRETLFRMREGILFSKIWRMLKHRFAGRNKEQASATADSQFEAVDVCAPVVDVLFYTFSNRDTCMGVGEKLFDKIRERCLNISTGFYQNELHPIIDSDQHHGSAVITLKVKPTIKGTVRFFQLLPFVYGFGLKSKSVSKFIFRHPLVTGINLLKITTTSACIEQMLNRVRPRVILSCNEQGGSDASILFALAKKKGIKTVQYMHAVPTKQFVPFICDEYWSWSELTTRMLVGPVEDSRVINMGSLEHESRELLSARSNIVSVEEKRVLFLAQMGMDEAWGIRSILDGMKMFREGLNYCQEPLKVRVREHPGAGDKEREMLLDSMGKIPFELSTKITPLAQDIEWATHIYTVCSNAIFAALLGGKPAYLIWNEELDGIYGRAFLPNENVVGNRAEFIESLNQITPASSVEATLQQSLGNPGAVDRAVDRIKELIATC